jgi:hypothetical protein
VTSVAVVPTEHDEQRMLVIWSEMRVKSIPALKLLYAVPNGGFRNKATAGKMRAEGLRPGVPDLCLPVARGTSHGLYIELKRTKGGRVSPDQREWIEALRAEGYSVVIPKGWRAAATDILVYLGEPVPVDGRL